jgi:hypothetical protein
MPRWPKKVESIVPAIDVVAPISEQPKNDLIVRTTCDNEYHLERGVAIGSGSFVCKYCGKRFIYKNNQITEYV